MIRGVIVGEVWATRQAAGLAGQKLLLIAVEAADRMIVAVDTLAARAGDTVLVSWGSGARNVIAPGRANRHLLCDAAVSLIVDGCSDRAARGEGTAAPGAVRPRRREVS